MSYFFLENISKPATGSKSDNNTKSQLDNTSESATSSRSDSTADKERLKAYKHFREKQAANKAMDDKVEYLFFIFMRVIPRLCIFLFAFCLYAEAYDLLIQIKNWKHITLC